MHYYVTGYHHAVVPTHKIANHLHKIVFWLELLKVALDLGVFHQPPNRVRGEDISNEHIGKKNPKILLPYFGLRSRVIFLVD